MADITSVEWKFLACLAKDSNGTCVSECLHKGLSPDVFSSPINRFLFKSLCYTADRGAKIDLGTLISSIEKLDGNEFRGLLKAGGVRLNEENFIRLLFDEKVLSSNFKEHFDTLTEAYRKKDLKEKLVEALNTNDDPKTSADNTVGAIEKILQEQHKIVRTDESVIIGDEGVSTLDWLLAREKVEFTGLPWPYKRLNRLIGGMDNGYLAMIIAHTGVGKSAFCLNVARNIAFGPDPAPVLYIDTEMPTESQKLRLIAQMSCVAERQLRNHIAWEQDTGMYKRVKEAADKIDELKTFIHLPIGPVFNIDRVKSAIIQHQVKYGIKFVVFDYVSEPDDTGNKEGWKAMSQFVLGLKEAALSCEIPILCSAQTVSMKEDRDVLKLNDIAMSKYTAHHCDYVLGLSKKSKQRYESDGNNAGNQILCVIKSRHGGDSEILDMPNFVNVHFQKDFLLSAEATVQPQ